MRKILVLFVLVALSIHGFTQDHKKIELAFMDYTESDSAFYNTEVPEDHYSYDNFDLYYHFDGDTAWVKIKKGKELKAALLANEVSLSPTKKFKRK